MCREINEIKPIFVDPNFVDFTKCLEKLKKQIDEMFISPKVITQNDQKIVELKMVGVCVCGGIMYGDGVTVIRHCEFYVGDISDKEPDSGPLYCSWRSF